MTLSAAGRAGAAAFVGTSCTWNTRFLRDRSRDGDFRLVAPSAPRIKLAEYPQTWIAQRSLEPGTRELYELQLRNHIEPYLGRKTLDTITPQTIRNWRQQRL